MWEALESVAEAHGTDVTAQVKAAVGLHVGIAIEEESAELTPERLRALREQARVDGDTHLEQLCTRALDGEAASLEQVREIVEPPVRHSRPR